MISNFKKTPLIGFFNTLILNLKSNTKKIERQLNEIDKDSTKEIDNIIK